jgi:hypothetical protein
LTTSAALRLNRLMSGVRTAPTMKPPATTVAPAPTLRGGQPASRSARCPRG